MLGLTKTDHLDQYPEIKCCNDCGWFEVRGLPHHIIAIAEPRHEQNGCFYLIPGRDRAIERQATRSIFSHSTRAETFNDSFHI